MLKELISVVPCSILIIGHFWFGFSEHIRNPMYVNSIKDPFLLAFEIIPSKASIFEVLGMNQVGIGWMEVVGAFSSNNSSNSRRSRSNRFSIVKISI